VNRASELATRFVDRLYTHSRLRNVAPRSASTSITIAALDSITNLEGSVRVIKRIGQLSIACLLLSVVEAHAIPVTFEFSATTRSYGTQNGGIPVPEQFNDFNFVFNAPITGSFTVDTDTVGYSSYRYLNGVLTESGTGYFNAVRELSLGIGDQQFSFLASAPAGSYPPAQSFVAVADLPVPSNDPTTNYDGVDINVNLGSGVFSGAYSHLSASFSLIRTEHDLSVISSRDMLSNLTPSQNWSAFFTIYDTAVPNRNYQIWASLTDLTQVTSVPEPSTAALLALGLALTVSGVRARRRSS
jgi:hypothetical protein